MVSALIVMPPLSGSCIQAAAIWQGGQCSLSLATTKDRSCGSSIFNPLGRAARCLACSWARAA